MIAPATFTLPAELRASQPPERRGVPRDHVRLMVVTRETREITHTRFDMIGEFLSPGDVLVVNSSRTLPAAVPARRQGGEPVQLRLCVRRLKTWDVLVVQPEPPHQNIALEAGERLVVAGTDGVDVLGRRPDIPLLWRLRVGRHDLEPILSAGEPIRYSYVPQPVPLAHYQTVFAARPGSAETPSAGRAFTWQLLRGLRERGVVVAQVVLHTGLSSFQDDAFDKEHHLFEEWFEVEPQAVDAIRSARRVIAVGTTVVRTLESAAAPGGRIRPLRGWTRLQIRPTTPLRLVQALLTGFHEPQASHFDLLRAFLPDALLERAYREAVERRYLWHEFGDLTLIL